MQNNKHILQSFQKLEWVGMTLRDLHTHRSLVSASLLALSISVFASESFAQTRLFPVSRPAGQISEAPPELPAISDVEPLPAPPVAAATGAAPVDGKPLRVIIPNIHQEEQKRKAFAASAKPAPTQGVATAPSQGHAQAVAQMPSASEASALKRLSQSIFEKAQEAWNNGVITPDWSNTPIIGTMFRPNLAFAPLPASWQVASSDAQAVASLAPAAGAAEAINMQPPPPIVPSAPSSPAAPAQPVVLDTSEPAPALSSQSKSIANKVSNIADKQPEKPLGHKVDIERAKTTDVLNANSAPKANDALGIKVATRTSLDVNYELERAYNALIAGKSETAIQIYEDILTSQPKNKEALFGLASTYHRLGQIDIARTLYGKLLEIDPKHRDGLNNFLVLLADEAPQEALTQMERLEAQNPSFSPIPAQMAIIYQKLGDQDKAVEKMYRALAIAPENITYRYNLAIMLDKSGKYEDAGKLYAQLLDSHAKGAAIPGDATKIQQRLTFIRSNSSK